VCQFTLPEATNLAPSLLLALVLTIKLNKHSSHFVASAGWRLLPLAHPIVVTSPPQQAKHTVAALLAA